MPRRQRSPHRRVGRSPTRRSTWRPWRHPPGCEPRRRRPPAARGLAAGRGPRRRRVRAGRLPTADAPARRRPPRRHPTTTAVPPSPAGRRVGLGRGPMLRPDARPTGRHPRTGTPPPTRTRVTEQTARRCRCRRPPGGFVAAPDRPTMCAAPGDRSDPPTVLGWPPTGWETADTWRQPPTGRRPVGAAATTGCVDLDDAWATAASEPQIRGRPRRMQQWTVTPPPPGPRPRPGRSSVPQAEARPPTRAVG